MEMKRPKIEEVEEDEEEEMRKKKGTWMKTAQLLEFQMQALVYRYIEAGLRVPHHLVVPIWKSLSSSSNYNFHSSSLVSDKVEPEPTRCRRTDGKKWRCSYTVLPFQKYCERHVNRGRNRSRKLVESSASYDVASSSVSSTKQGNNTHGLESNNESQRVPSNAKVVTIASLPGVRACDNVTRPSLASHSARSKRYLKMSYDDFLKQRESSTTDVRGGEESSPSVQKFFPEVSDISLEAAKFSRDRKNDIIARSREWKNMNINGGLLFPGIHFSPDTVLQDRGGFHIHRFETDSEPGRCRRTDGKKWRCSKDVLSGQKYCDKHMHRGIKKQKHPVNTSTTNSIDNAGFIPLTMKPAAATSVSCDDGDDRKRSVSFLGVPLYRVPDEKSASSCSTDTTITDTALKGEEDNEEVLSLCSSGV